MRAKVAVRQSTRSDKRMMAEFQTKTIHFGARNGSTFVDHQDMKTKENWIKRHRANSDFNDFDSAGSLARYVLWNKSTLYASIQDLNRRQNQYMFVLKK